MVSNALEESSQEPIAVTPKDRVCKVLHGAVANAIDPTSSHVSPTNQTDMIGSIFWVTNLDYSRASRSRKAGFEPKWY